jgi:signal transduction histidine kinase
VSFNEGLQLLTQLTILGIVVVTARSALARPTRANVDTALLFFAAFVVIVEQRMSAMLGVEGPLAAAVGGIAAMGLPYVSVRLVDDFGGGPRWVSPIAAIGFVLGSALLVWYGRAMPGWATLAVVLYFVVALVYAGVAFALATGRVHGVTRRRLQAVALGSLALGLAALTSAGAGFLPGQADLMTAVTRFLAVVTSVAYFVGFAPPRWLRRAWQEPELRAFLGRAATLPHLPTTAAIVAEIERGAAEALGATHAHVGLWDEARGVLRFPMTRTDVAAQPAGLEFDDEGMVLSRPGEGFTGAVFANQRAMLALNWVSHAPQNAALYRAYGMQTGLGAPITAGQRRLGVLAVYAPRAPFFVDDDMALVQLLADQAAVVLESRALIDEATRVRAQEEATRLRDDFLSAAAHDLKTPLTTLLGSAQLMMRRHQRAPEAPPDERLLEQVEREARRMRDLVLELLDAARIDERKLLGQRVEVDLAQLVETTATRLRSARHPFRVEAEGAVAVTADVVRIEQLLNNLCENAVKYSPEGGAVAVRVWREGDEARLSVADQGIGIEPADLPHLFERYHRGANVDDRRFAGMGLGLYICRGIVEEHGGRIWVESTPGQGSTFQVALPAAGATASAPPERSAAIPS